MGFVWSMISSWKMEFVQKSKIFMELYVINNGIFNTF